MRIFLREELTEALVAGLVDGRLDLILVALPHDVGAIETELLFEDGYQLATPPGHALAASLKVTGEALARSPLLLLEKGHCLQRHALSAFPQSGAQADEGFAATSLPTLISMVAEGLGITLLPQLAIDAGVARGQQIELTPLPDACPRRVVLAWRPTSPHVARFREIAALLRTTRAAM